MIRLLPNTNEQVFNIVPRDIPLEGFPFNDISLVVVEDGTSKKETINDIVATLNGNFVSVSVTFSILTDENSYYLEFSKDNSLWFRDKAYVTSQTNDETIHTINTSKYNQYNSGEDEYIVL